MRSRAIRMLSAAVVLLAALGTAAAPAHAQKKTKTASNAKLCEDATKQQREFQLRNDQVATDMQTINRFGFRRTVAEFEEAANLPAALVWDGGVEGIQKLLFDKTLESTRAELLRQAQAGALTFAKTAAKEATRVAAQRPIGGPITPQTRELLLALSRSGNLRNQRIGTETLAYQELYEVLTALDDAKKAYGIADKAAQGEMMKLAATLAHEVAKEGLKRIGTVIPSLAPAARAGWVGALLSLDEWAWLQAYKSHETVNTVQALTVLTEQQLLELKYASARLKENIPRLKVLRAQLPKMAGQCDRTQLVKKPKGWGSWIVAGALTGGALYGGAKYAEQQRLKEEGGGGNGGGTSNSYCLSTRNCIVNTSGSCSCSSGGEACGYSSPGSGVGGSCPCRSGLSCNNGRCESRTGGRCP